jgi:hypothetical protein
MPFTHSYSTTFTKGGESISSNVTLSSSGEINLDTTVAASGTKTLDTDYLPSKVVAIIISSSGNCTLQAKDSANANLGSAITLQAITSGSVTRGVYFYYTGSNTGSQPLCNTSSLTTPVASILVTDTSAAANAVSIRVLYEASN